MYKIGDRLIIRYPKTTDYYLGTIKRVTPEFYSILFDDGDKIKVKSDSKLIIAKAVKAIHKESISKNEIEKYSMLDKDKLSDPKYIKSLSKSQLVKLMRVAKDTYYNSGDQFVTDAVYDMMEDQLRKLDPKHSLLEEIGAPADEINKVELPYYMPSLDKIKPETVNTWLQKNPGPYCVSDKIDGISLELVSEKGKWNLYTRGDGTTGQDVSFLSKYLNIPKAPVSKIAIRAELSMTESNFKSLETKAANARNFVSGLSRNLKSTNKKHLQKVDVVAYEVITPIKKPSDQFILLKKLGFKVAGFKVLDEVTREELVSLLLNRKQKSTVAMDGLVVTLDKVNKRTTSGNPKYSVSFKMLTSDQIAVVKVVNVEWNPSKHGFLKPRVEIEPIVLKGVKITYCTGFNAKFIKDNKIGPGATLKISRSGDVIPHILEVLKPSKKPQMPDPEEFEYDWTDSGVDIYIESDNEVVNKKKLNNFFRTIGVDNISYGIISKLYDEGYDDIFKVLSMKQKDIAELSGFGDTIAIKLITNIKKSLNNVTLPLLMKASNCFDKNLGLTRLEQVCNDFPKILDDPEKGLSMRLETIPGFSSIISKSFVAGLSEFKKFYSRALKVGIRVVDPKKIKSISKKLDKVTVVFTGFRDSILEEIVIENSGKIGSGVNSNTTILLVKDKNSNSSKIVKAEQLGVKIMTRDEFKKKYKL